MNSLKRATTMPKRKPSARNFPASAACLGFGGGSGLNFLVMSAKNKTYHRDTEDTETHRETSVNLCVLCAPVVGVHFPLKAAARFSRNADVPSFLSSVAQATAKSVASRKRPSESVMSMPWLTASMVYCT